MANFCIGDLVEAPTPPEHQDQGHIGH